MDIVHTLMPNSYVELTNSSLGVAPLIAPLIVAINPAAVVTTTNSILMQVGNFTALCIVILPL